MTSIVTDPVLGHAAAAFLAIVLLSGAWAKLRDIALLRAAMDNYQLVPDAWLPVVAWLLPLTEALAALALLPTAWRPLGAALAAGVLLVVSGAVVINLRRGRQRIDCGCGGSEHQPLSWGLVARNAVLIALCGLAALPLAERGTVWLDLMASTLATLFALGLYALVNQLLANHPRLLDLRNHP